MGSEVSKERYDISTLVVKEDMLSIHHMAVETGLSGWLFTTMNFTHEGSSTSNFKPLDGSTGVLLPDT